MKTHIVNISGGRTSAKLAIEIENLKALGKLDGDVEYVFADTGAEHPDTYRFIKDFAKNLGIKITCLRAKISTQLGVGTTYEVISLDDIGYNLKVWEDMLKAYSSPFNPGGGFCTDMLKSIPSDKYCNEKYGKGNFYKWIGYRADEAKRAWGHEIYSKLVKLGLDNDDCKEMMVSLMSSSDPARTASSFLCDTPDMLDQSMQSDLLNKISLKIEKIKKSGFRFMFEIDDSEKQDILNYWKDSPIDLKINEYLGNCVFCIKKGDNKIELAARDEPKMAEEWESIFNKDTVRDLNRGFHPNVIYRGKLTFGMIRMKYAGVESSEISDRMRWSKTDGTNAGCSDSCSAFSNQLDMFD